LQEAHNFNKQGKVVVIMGAREVNERKLREMIKYISMLSEGDKNFGRTKLNKILFYCDFIAYRNLGKSISGNGYHKQQYGPVPHNIGRVLNKMIDDGEMAEIPRIAGSYEQKRPAALKEADLSIFTQDEISLIDAMVGRLFRFSATKVSDLSHEFIGWKAARIGEDIPYETALLEMHEATEEEKEYGMTLLRKYEETLSR